jgi:hypothetical protein
MDQNKQHGSKVEVLPGTVIAHGGPHVFRNGVCSCGLDERLIDEVEIVDVDIWEKSQS